MRFGTSHRLGPNMDTVVIQLQAARAWRKRLYRLASRSMDGGSGQNYHGWITPKPNRTGPRLASFGAWRGWDPTHPRLTTQGTRQQSGSRSCLGVPHHSPEQRWGHAFLRGFLFREGRVRFKIRMRSGMRRLRKQSQQSCPCAYPGQICAVEAT